MLNKSNFKTSPASTKYHNNIEGGLCDHCLKVYDNMVKLADIKGIQFDDKDSILIAALMHDLSKINSYIQEPANVKKYCKSQEEYDKNPSAYNKHDSLGTCGWFTELRYSFNKDTFDVGGHEKTAEYIARSYIPLRTEESVAINNHMGGLGWDSAKIDYVGLYKKYPLALLLFEADLMSTVLDEVCVE